MPDPNKESLGIIEAFKAKGKLEEKLREEGIDSCSVEVCLPKPQYFLRVNYKDSDGLPAWLLLGLYEGIRISLSPSEGDDTGFTD